jgi:hypothetical protein
MKRGAWIALGVAGVAVGACTYPEFEFRSEGQGGAGGVAGAGGDGGAGGSGGAGGVVSIAIVPCDRGMITCAMGQGCCFDLVKDQNMEYQDFCGEPGNCGEGYTGLRCNSTADCMGTDICCGNLNPAMTLFLGTACKSECDASERTACDPDPLITDQCPFSCVATLYGGYGYCADS